MNEESKKILNSDSGRELREYLIGKLNELKNIDSVKDIDTPTHQAVEIKAQRKAYIKLKEILSEIIIFSEEIKPKDKRDSFNIIV